MDRNAVSPSVLTAGDVSIHIRQLFDRFGIHAEGNWDEDKLRILEESSFLFFGMTPENYKKWFWTENLVVRLEDMSKGGLTSKNLVLLNPANLTSWTVVHELAHAWDASQGWKLSTWMARATGSQFNYPLFHRMFPKSKSFWYAVGNPPPPCGVDANFNKLEDFAESVAAYLFPEEAKKRAEERGWSYERFGCQNFHETFRGKWIDQLVHQK